MKLINKGNKVIGYRGNKILPGDSVEVADKDCTENGTIAMLIKTGKLVKSGAVKATKAEADKTPDNGQKGAGGKSGDGKEKA